jgi:two-component system chemotaxis response regulator CheB
VLAAADIAPLLTRLASEQVEGLLLTGSPEVSPAEAASKESNAASGITCPACHGSLWEVPGDVVPGFECRVGHRFSAEALLEEQATAVESAIWGAINSLRERAEALRRVAARLDQNSTMVSQYLERATEADSQAETIQQALTRVIQADAVGGW